MGTKLTMANAYDRIEWDFLGIVLEALGLHNEFINVILEFVSPISFSISLNRSPCGLVNPSKGLRQVDPLSPYLFILGIEVLSRMLLKEEDEGNVHGTKVSRSVPSISQLFFSFFLFFISFFFLFADDIPLFHKAMVSKVKVVKDTLDDSCFLFK